MSSWTNSRDGGNGSCAFSAIVTANAAIGPMRLNAQGRLWLKTVELWLGHEEGRVVCYNQQGQAIPEPREAIQRAEQASRNACRPATSQLAEQEQGPAQQPDRAGQEQNACRLGNSRTSNKSAGRAGASARPGRNSTFPRGIARLRGKK